MAYIALSQLAVVPDPAEEIRPPARLFGMVIVTACLGVTAASAYEIYEWVADSWFGQHLLIGESDTVNDLADGFLGAAAGGLLIARWALSRYSTRRAGAPGRPGRGCSTLSRAARAGDRAAPPAR